MNQEKTAIASAVAEEDFGLDPLGNWTDYVQKTSGTTVLDQDRTHNKVNETTDITETTGPAWVMPAHDRAGNMTTMPWPEDPTVEMDCVYDAWNRLVRTPFGPLVYGKQYDGLNRQTMRLDRMDPFVQYAEYRYYTSSWQLIETRTATSSTQPESLQPQHQYPSSTVRFRIMLAEKLLR